MSDETKTDSASALTFSGDDKLYELLLTEKALADSQIVGYSDLSLKILGFFGGTVAVLGWLYSDKGIGANHPVAAAAICIAVVLLGCGIILQGVSTYGIALGYIQYKHQTLNRAFARVAGITRQYPFNHVRAWWKGVARLPVLLATLGLTILHAVLSVALIIFATCQFAVYDAQWYLLGALFALVALIFTFYVEYRLYVAIRQIFAMHVAFPPEPFEEHDISQAG
jgi:hypothetical protein